MGYIDRTMLPDEKILYRTKKHYIVFLQPALWACGALFFLLNASPYVVKAGWVFAAIAFFSWLNAYVNYAVSEYAITNKRLIMCEGFFIKHTNDTRLATISNLNVDQTLFGQILNYGVLIIKTYGGDDDPFMDIPKPFEFKNCLQMQLDQVTERPKG